MIGLLVFATAFLIPAQVGADRGTPVSLGSMSCLVGIAVVFLLGSLLIGIRLGLAVNGERILDAAVFPRSS
ncbi:MAG TPA: hypothetical protein VK200_06685 [Candidatus Limnocylindrales bacterium]|nr:hypothetical protein [Candidatus Limnocylindrales bacterium]